MFITLIVMMTLHEGPGSQIKLVYGCILLGYSALCRPPYIIRLIPSHQIQRESGSGFRVVNFSKKTPRPNERSRRLQIGISVQPKLLSSLSSRTPKRVQDRERERERDMHLCIPLVRTSPETKIGADWVSG